MPCVRSREPVVRRLRPSLSQYIFVKEGGLVQDFDFQRHFSKYFTENTGSARTFHFRIPSPQKLLWWGRVFAVTVFVMMFAYTFYFRDAFTAYAVSFDDTEIRLQYDTIDTLLQKGFTPTDSAYVTLLDDSLEKLRFLNAVTVRSEVDTKISIGGRKASPPFTRRSFNDGGISLSKGDTAIAVYVVNDSPRSSRRIRECPIYAVTWFAQDAPTGTCTINEKKFDATMDIAGLRKAFDGFTERQTSGRTYTFSQSGEGLFQIELNSLDLLGSIKLGVIPHTIKAPDNTYFIYSAILFLFVTLHWVGEIVSKRRKRRSPAA